MQLVELARPALESGEKVAHTLAIRNVDRTVGTILGHEVTMATVGSGLKEGTVEFTFNGTAGQSFGAFVPRGVTLRLVGDSNDYVGKGLCGGRLVVTPDAASSFEPSTEIVAGNVIGYGATSGEILLRGVVGERFCVRNSGATAVVEGVGDHALEYMTGGEVLILGPTGRNVAAGMSGGSAWVLDLNTERLNTELVDPQRPDEQAVARIRELLELHRDQTGSTLAEGLLGHDDGWLADHFTAIVPRDYARVIKARQDALTAGIKEDEMTDLMMEAAHG